MVKFTRKEFALALEMSKMMLGSTTSDNGILKTLKVKYLEEAFERNMDGVKEMIGENYKSVIALALHMRLCSADFMRDARELVRQISIALEMEALDIEVFRASIYNIESFEKEDLLEAFCYVRLDANEFDKLIASLNNYEKMVVMRMGSKNSVTFFGNLEKDYLKSKITNCNGWWAERSDSEVAKIFKKKMTEKQLDSVKLVPRKMAKFFNVIARNKETLSEAFPEGSKNESGESWEDVVNKLISLSFDVSAVDVGNFDQAVVDERIEFDVDRNLNSFDFGLVERHSDMENLVGGIVLKMSQKSTSAESLKGLKPLNGCDSKKVGALLGSELNKESVLSAFFNLFPDSELGRKPEYRGMYLETVKNIIVDIVDFQFIERLYKNADAVRGLIALVGLEEFVRLGSKYSVYATRMALSTGVQDEKTLFENKDAFTLLAEYDTSPYRKKALMDRIKTAVENVEKTLYDEYDLYVRKGVGDSFDELLPPMSDIAFEKYVARIASYDKEKIIKNTRSIFANLDRHPGVNKDAFKKQVLKELFGGEE